MKLSKSSKLVFMIGFLIGGVLLFILIYSNIKVLDKVLTPEPPSGFKLFFIAKKENTEDISINLKVEQPAVYQFFIAPNFNGEKYVKMVSERRFIGLYTNEIVVLEGNYGNSQVGLLLLPGNYKFYVNIGIKGASIYFYTNTIIPDKDYVDRLTRIDGGKIYNPPANYKEIFKTNLNNIKVNNLTVARFEIKNAGEYGFSAYSTISRGRFSLRLVGGGYKGVDLLNETRLISDQISLYLQPASYEVLLSSFEADASIVLYITNYQ
ncbi:MAG: hypothetical protein ACP5QT_08275 [Brevinematia bacterium]